MKRTRSEIIFTPSDIVLRSPELYDLVTLNTHSAVKSFRLSLFSFEVLTPNGQLKNSEELNPEQAAMRRKVLEIMKKTGVLPYPIAGIGLNDNIEFGYGRDIFMTLASEGWSSIPCHIRKAQFDEFEPFLA